MTSHGSPVSLQLVMWQQIQNQQSSFHATNIVKQGIVACESGIRAHANEGVKHKQSKHRVEFREATTLRADETEFGLYILTPNVRRLGKSWSIVNWGLYHVIAGNTSYSRTSRYKGKSSSRL